jgi:hypothetical protein
MPETFYLIQVSTVSNRYLGLHGLLHITSPFDGTALGIGQARTHIERNLETWSFECKGRQQYVALRPLAGKPSVTKNVGRLPLAGTLG